MARATGSTTWTRKGKKDKLTDGQLDIPAPTKQVATKAASRVSPGKGKPAAKKTGARKGDDGQEGRCMMDAGSRSPRRWVDGAGV